MISSEDSNQNSGVLGTTSMNRLNSRTVNGKAEDGVHKCPECQKTFSTRQTLSIHMKTAKYCLEKKPNKVFECEYCGKRLSSKQMMLYHDDICAKKREYMYDKRIQEIEAMMTSSRRMSMSTTDEDFENVSPSSVRPLKDVETESKVMMNKPLPKRHSREVHSSQSFCHMNVMVQCQLLSVHSKSPTKKDSLVYQIYPCIERPIQVEALTPMTISTGLSLSIPPGWHAVLMNCDALHDEMLVVQDIFDTRSSKEVQVRVYNMMNRSITIDPDQPIAQLAFHKHADTFNVHVHCKSHPVLT